MSNLSPRQVNYGGNFSTLYDVANKVIVKAIPFVESQTYALAGVNYTLVDATILPGNISLGTTTAYSGGVVAAVLAGAVGTAAITTIADSFGNITNLVRIRDASTHDPITANNREVFGLIQAASTVTDGDAIGAVASKNLQMSFVYVATNGTLTLTAVTATIEFQVNKAIKDKSLPAYEFQGGNVSPDIVTPVGSTQKVAKYVVTTAFAANEIITLTTGAGAVTGVATASGDKAGVLLEASANAFRDNNQIEVQENGLEVIKSTDFIWDTTTTGHFIIALDIGDTFTVKYFA